MLEMGLFSIRATAKQDYMKLHEPEKKRNLLRQQFQADRPNQIWVSDVTCFKLVEFYLYTCVILDLFSRKVVAYKVSRKTSTHLITSTFKAAWEQCAPDAGLIFTVTEGLNTPYIGSDNYFMSAQWYNLSPIRGNFMTTLLRSLSSPP